jgi:hypothetical protein
MLKASGKCKGRTSKESCTHPNRRPLLARWQRPRLIVPDPEINESKSDQAKLAEWLYTGIVLENGTLRKRLDILALLLTALVLSCTSVSPPTRLP